MYRPYSIRLPPDVADALERLATEEDRSNAAQIVRFVREGLERLERWTPTSPEVADTP